MSPAKLEDIPNIGKSIAADLRSLGILDPRQLATRDPLKTYLALSNSMGKRHDPCVLYTLMAAQHYLQSGESIPWWKFTEQGKRMLAESAPRKPGKMKTYIALLRGINIGGHNKLPMNELVAVLESLGLQNVRTYIQSGNAVFQSKASDSAKLAKMIGAEIRKRRGFESKVLLLDAAKLDKAIKANPFPEAEAEGNTLHFIFLAAVPPDPDLAGIKKIRTASERCQLNGDVFYLHAPDGAGRSKLASHMERLLGVQTTGRNWNTVRKLMAMALDNEEGYG